MEVSLTNCDKELVHVPNYIQYGAMLVLSPKNIVVACSANAKDILLMDISPIGANAETIFDNFSCRSGYVQLSRHGSTYECIFNISPELIIINIEVTPREHTIEAVTTNHMLGIVQKSIVCDPKAKIDDVLGLIASIVRKISGFDRVMVYKFDNDFTGKVVAEEIVEGAESYFEHRFPAGDIPLPARNLYTKNILRTIPDVLLEPIHLEFLDEFKIQTVDMTHSVLRGVSQMHTEYLKNMGVRATMSLSIVFDNKLWGLVACHNSVPKYIPFVMMQSLEIITRIFTKSIASHEYTQEQVSSNLMLNNISRLSSSIKGQAKYLDFNDLLKKNISDIASLISSGGIAVIYQKNIMVHGNTPSNSDINNILTAIRTVNPQNGFFATDSMIEFSPRALDYKTTAAGVVAILGDEHFGVDILWFKPEVTRIEKWGGNPEKNSEIINGILTISPRKSFETWYRTVELSSEPIDRDAYEILQNIKNMLLDIIDVSTAQESVRSANQALQQSQLSTIAELSSNLAHQWRQPLAALSMNIQDLVIANDFDELDSDYLNTFKKNSMETLKYLSGTIESFSQIFKNESNSQIIDVGKSIFEAYMFLSDTLKSAGIKLTIEQLDDDLLCSGSPIEFSQVILGIFSNAKDALVLSEVENKSIVVSIEKDSNSVKITIKDNAGGVSEDMIDKIFQPYTTTKHKYQGAGLGMYAAKMLVEQNLGGILTVHNTSGWAFFTIMIPLAP